MLRWCRDNWWVFIFPVLAVLFFAWIVAILEMQELRELSNQQPRLSALWQIPEKKQ